MKLKICARRGGGAHGGNMFDLRDVPVSRIPVVNVATVPQRSPLRYPGGKTWLIPHIREWLGNSGPDSLIEPFAGGGTVSLTGVMENLVSTALMIEIDPKVAAFWRSVLEHGTILKERILQFEPTIERLREIERSTPSCVLENGFRTLVLNRTRRGGILAKGASFTRRGENGKGVVSRWYPETLADRLAAIQDHAARISFTEGDALNLLPALLRGRGGNAAVFIDPPYTAGGGKRAGSRLYDHSFVDHGALFSMMADYRPNFMMTYDAAPEIVELARKHGFHAAALSMKNGHHNRIAELVITPAPIFV
ncbi:MAG: DNA adenine methylase [Rhodobacteraceae bacterium]|nr:DNA adenine methylase [Paracoccaceae bacterium]